MKKYFNESCSLALAVCIALATPSLTYIIGTGIDSMMRSSQDQTVEITESVEQKNHNLFEKIAPLGNVQLGKEEKEASLWFCFIGIAINVLLFLFISNPLVRTGLFMGILAIGYLYELPVIFWIVISLLGIKTLISDRAFGRAYFKVVAVVIVALIVFLGITVCCAYLYTPSTLLLILIYILPLLIASYIIPYPVISVGLVYAVAYIVMQELRVFLVGPQLGNDLIALGIVALVPVYIVCQSRARELLKSN